METNESKRYLLRDLALVYVSLAHSTDRTLDPTEIDAVASRLQQWEAHAASETVVGAIRQAVEMCAAGVLGDELDGAIERLGEVLPPDQRLAVVDDLIEVAMADDRFLYEESTFIGRLEQAWDVRQFERQEEDDRRWSILNQDGQAGVWTPVHDLVLVYLALAHGTDDELSTDEVGAICTRLNEWLPDAKEVDVLGIIQEAMQVYSEEPYRRSFSQAVETVGKFLPEHQRAALLDDLHYVARADGVLLERERFMIDQLAHAWGLEPAQT